MSTKKESKEKRKGYLVLNEKDNVALAIRELPKGFEVEVTGKKVALRENIEFGHKFALTDIKKGEKVIKGGEVIGAATRDIMAGEHVHVHNIESLRAKERTWPRKG
ncbi:MAG: UxaA family hydrolase [Conexivisphaerales archaeon]